MILISNVTYPPAATREVTKRYLTAPILPEYIVKKGPYISADISGGMHSITYYELANNRLADGMKAVAESLSVYADIPGYNYELKPYFELEEGLGILGL